MAALSKHEPKILFVGSHVEPNTGIYMQFLLVNNKSQHPRAGTDRLGVLLMVFKLQKCNTEITVMIAKTKAVF